MSRPDFEAMTAAETLAQYQALAGQATVRPWNLDRFGLIVQEGFWDEETDKYVATVADEEDSLFIMASRTLGPAMAAALQEILNQSDQPPGKFASDEQEQVAVGYSQALDLVRSIIGWHLEGK